MTPLRPRRLMDAILIVSAAAVALLGQRATLPDTPGDDTEVLGIQITRDESAVPPGQAKKVFGISGDVAALAPGLGRTLRLTLTNPNNFAIVVDGLSVSVGDASPTCRSGHVIVSAYSDLRTVPANGSVTTDLTVTLRNTAPDACKNASFPLAYRGTAAKVNQT